MKPIIVFSNECLFLALTQKVFISYLLRGVGRKCSGWFENENYISFVLLGTLNLYCCSWWRFIDTISPTATFLFLHLLTFFASQHICQFLCNARKQKRFLPLTFYFSSLRNQSVFLSANHLIHQTNLILKTVRQDVCWEPCAVWPALSDFQVCWCLLYTFQQAWKGQTTIPSKRATNCYVAILMCKRIQCTIPIFLSLTLPVFRRKKLPCPHIFLILTLQREGMWGYESQL